MAQIKEYIRTVKNNGDVILSNLLDSNTGEAVEYIKVVNPVGITPKGVIYRQLVTAENGTEIFKRVYTGSIKSEWYGVDNTGVVDNSLIYDDIISEADTGSTIEFEPNKTYLGYFNSNKALTIDGNGSKFINPNTSSRVFNFQGDLNLTFATLTQPCHYGDNLLNLSTTSTLVKGDVLVLCDDSARPADNKAEINLECIKVKEVISGTQISVEDIVRSDQTVGNLRVFKLTTLKNVGLHNIIAEAFPNTNLETIRFLSCENVVTNNITILKSNRAGILRQYCYNMTSNNITISYATNIGSGFGYGISSVGCRVGYDINIKSNGQESIYDLSGCYSIDVKSVKGTSSSGVVLAHNSFGGNIKCTDVDIEGGSGAVVVSNQGVEDFYNFIIRDLTIRDIKHSFGNEYPSVLRPVFIGCSYSNLVIDNVSLVITDEDYTPTNGHSIVFSYGSPVGKAYINNLSANNVGIALYLESLSPVTVSGTDSELDINNIYVNNCNVVGYLRSPINISIGNVVANNVNSYLFGLGAINIVNRLNFYGVISYIGASTILNRPSAYNTVIFKGKRWELNNLNTTSIAAGANFLITQAILEQRTTVNLNVITTDKTMHPTSALPSPIYANQKFDLFLNDGGPRRGSFTDLIIPSTNTNINNIGLGIRLLNGNMYTFTADANGKWNITYKPIPNGRTIVENKGLYLSSDDGTTLKGELNFGGITTSSISSGVGFPESLGFGTVWTYNGNSINGSYSLYLRGVNGLLYIQNYNTSGVGLGWRPINTLIGDDSLRTNNEIIGFSYFSTVSGKPIYYNGTNWVDATGSTV